MAVKPFVAFVDFLGKMGLILRGDPPRSIDVADRQWGPEVRGVSLSIKEIPKQDPDQLASISVVMKNNGTEKIPMTIPGWTRFYSVEIEAPPTPYGKALLRPDRPKEDIDIVLGPGDATGTDLPVASLYEMRKSREYPVTVSCHLPGGEQLQSNQLKLHP